MPSRTRSSTAPPTPDRTDRRRWLALGVVSLAQLMVVLDGTIVNIALPSAQQDLGFSDGQRQWVVTAYALAFGSLLLLGGRVADLVGRRISFLVGLVGFAAASAVAGAAGSFAILVAARAGQGVFGALLAPAALSLVTSTFTDTKSRAKAFTIYGSISGAGGAIGLLLGGVLTEYLSWRWTLYVNLAFAAVALVGGVLLIERTARDRNARLDVPGVLLVSSGLFCVVYGFANAESHAWSSPATWGFLAAGVSLLVLFTWWQTKAAHPLLPLRILLDRNRGASYACLLVTAVGTFGIFLFLTYYLEQSLGYSAVLTGLAFMPMVASLMVGAAVSNNALVPRFGLKPVVSLGMGLAAAGLALMTTFGVTSGYVTHIVPALVLAGAGMGLVMAPAQSAATLGVAAEDAGVASAAVNAMIQIGGSIGTALLTSLSASAIADYLAEHDAREAGVQAQASLAGYHTAFWWSAGFFAFGLMVSLLLYTRGTKHQRSDTVAVHM